MTRMEDLLRLKEARIDALQREIIKLRDEIKFLKADIEVSREINNKIYN
tara:strand:- start:16311 stop:16457 length:147 start_codon:yes stop_codon:yes gene_type:complete